ncbi:MAG: ParB/RepB/Spo0J family partition protein [Syntrophobacterales bacterium]|jgi:ParB family chromosome partitioning protein
MPTTKFRFIQFAEVDWNDAVCLITYGPLPDKLFLSIKAVGLLQKPLLQRKENGLFRIICGSRRLAVSRELGLQPLPCQILPDSLPLHTCLRMAIYDNLAHRRLNPVEKSLVLTKMADHMDKSKLIEEFMSPLDLEPSVILLERYEKLVQLEPFILDSLASGRLNERVAFALTPLEQTDRLALFQLFQELPFSVSVEEELVEMVVEIGRRQGIGLAEVINLREIREIRQANTRPARQRAQDIRRYLQTLRSPRLTARKERFAKEVHDLGLPAGVRLVPPPHFEGPRWRLECAFERGDELAARLRHLAELADRGEFQRVMKSVC